MVVRGNYACIHSGAECSTEEYCTERSETRANTVELTVTCCNEESIGSRPQCISNVDFKTAEQKCEEQGLRLCTADEIKAGSGEATGCGFDGKLAWTSTSCNLAGKLLDVCNAVPHGLVIILQCNCMYIITFWCSFQDNKDES